MPYWKTQPQFNAEGIGRRNMATESGLNEGCPMEGAGGVLLTMMMINQSDLISIKVDVICVASVRG